MGELCGGETALIPLHRATGSLAERETLTPLLFFWSQ